MRTTRIPPRSMTLQRRQALGKGLHQMKQMMTWRCLRALGTDFCKMIRSDGMAMMVCTDQSVSWCTTHYSIQAKTTQSDQRESWHVKHTTTWQRWHALIREIRAMHCILNHTLCPTWLIFWKCDMSRCKQLSMPSCEDFAFTAQGFRARRKTYVSHGTSSWAGREKIYHLQCTYVRAYCERNYFSYRKDLNDSSFSWHFCVILCIFLDLFWCDPTAEKAGRARISAKFHITLWKKQESRAQSDPIPKCTSFIACYHEIGHAVKIESQNLFLRDIIQSTYLHEISSPSTYLPRFESVRFHLKLGKIENANNSGLSL